MGSEDIEEQFIIGNRIPRHFFITKGTGESNIAIHAGSYHLALKNAGIECYNHLTYSSILPGIAREIQKPDSYVHGSVAETIAAVAHATKGERATAGIIHGWLLDKETEQKYGGLVCEYNGHDSLDEAEGSLHSSLKELYEHGFAQKYHLKNIKFMGETFIPKKKHGTALVAMVFVDYVYPILSR